MEIIKLTLLGEPRTKKNSQRMIQVGGKSMLIQSKQYLHYEKDCLKQIPERQRQSIDRLVNVKCLYYMGTKRKVDLTNLLNATDDILVKAKVLADDNAKIVGGHDGSRVLHDKENPRVVIEIAPL